MFASKEDIDAILKCLPTTDEALKLEPYVAAKRPLSDLAPVERFLLELAKIPQIEQRLATYAFRFTVPEALQEAKAVLVNRAAAMDQARLRAMLSMRHADSHFSGTWSRAAIPFLSVSPVKKGLVGSILRRSPHGSCSVACVLDTVHVHKQLPSTCDDGDRIVAVSSGGGVQVVESKAFAAALAATLALGNFLNAGTTNGDAVAYKLEALVKLADTKSLDGDASLLSFLADALLHARLAPLAAELPALLSPTMDTAIEARSGPAAASPVATCVC